MEINNMLKKQPLFKKTTKIKTNDTLDAVISYIPSLPELVAEVNTMSGFYRITLTWHQH